MPSFDAEDDAKLLAACLDGDRRALDAFVTRFSRVVWFYVNSTLRRSKGGLDPHRAEDLHQQVFVALLERDLHRLRLWRPDGGASVATWIRVITVRITLAAMKRDGRTVLFGDGEGPSRLIDPDADPFERLLEKEGEARRAQLFDLAEQLSESDRLLLQMIFVQRMDARAIAAALQIKPSQVYVRKSRMVTRLRRYAEAQGLVDP